MIGGNHVRRWQRSIPGSGTRTPVSRRDIPVQAGAGPGNEGKEAFDRDGADGGCDAMIVRKSTKTAPSGAVSATIPHHAEGSGR